MIIKRFEELEIWQEARELCKYILKFTLKEPFANDYRFRDQIRASAGSAMDNIAEGFDRGVIRNFISFYLYQEALAERSDLNHTELSIGNIFLQTS
jgi:four helix bundle protein